MDSTPELEFTGERFTPECVREIFYEHWHRYAWARALVADRDVLDCACGEGYGARLLAGAARAVTAVDADQATIEHASARYRAGNLEFRTANALNLPFDAASFDTIVSFETLEHLAEHDELMAEFRRVLRPDGFILVSSPDRKTYSDETGYVNEFHVRELYRDEFETLLARHFPNYRLYGQKLMFHSVLWPMDPGRPAGAASLLRLVAGAHLRAGDRPFQAPMYYIALAGGPATDLPSPDGVSLFDDDAESVYAHYDDVVRKHIAAERKVAEQAEQIRRLETAGTGLWKRLRRLIRRR